MNSLKRSRWGPILTAFAIWFLHFMMCWVAAEIWPHQRTANALAWGVTAVALLAMGLQNARVTSQHADGELPDWDYRFARGAIAIATAAVLFSAMPSVIFLP